MKKIILFVPGLVFLIFSMLPFIIWGLGIELENELVIMLAILIPVLSLYIWGVSLVLYMKKEAENKQFADLIVVLLSLIFCVEVVFYFIDDPESVFSLQDRLFMFILLLTQIVAAILQTILIKRVFYARTTWFLFLELFMIPLGMITLTPDVQEWEKGDKS